MKDRIFFMDKPLSLYMNKYFNTLSILLAGIYSILFFIVSVDIIDLNQKRCIIRKTNKNKYIQYKKLKSRTYNNGKPSRNSTKFGTEN